MCNRNTETLRPSPASASGHVVFTGFPASLDQMCSLNVNRNHLDGSLIVEAGALKVPNDSNTLVIDISGLPAKFFSATF